MSKRLLTVMVVLFLIMTAGLVEAGTTVGGPISQDTVWGKVGSPYIVTTGVDIQPGVVLTIEPGVEVRFEAGGKIQVNGQLVAQGTASEPIRFTSNAAEPAPGDWENIEFTETAAPTTIDEQGNYISGSVLSHCIIEHAGQGDEVDSALIGRSLLVDHCTIRNNAARGIQMLGTESEPGWITNSTIANNTLSGWYHAGGGIWAEHTVIAHNVIRNNQVPGMQRTYGGGIVAGGSEIRNNLIEGNYAYDEGGGIYVGYTFITPTPDGPATITNNIIRNNRATRGGGIGVNGYGSNGNDGSVIASNTITANTAAIAGGGVFMRNAPATILENNPITGNQVNGELTSLSTSSGGGVSADSGIVRDNLIFSNHIFNTNAEGVGVEINGPVVLEGNVIVFNHGQAEQITGGIHVADSDPQIHQNDIYGNFPFNAVNDVEDDIDVTNNYWGTTDQLQILASTYDWHDDSERGKFIFQPYLNEGIDNSDFAIHSAYLPIVIH